MSGAWRDAVRPAIVRELLRPLLLARDVERGWLGELLGRAAWPELLYPMLAAWNAQWSGDEAEPRDALPIVHARPLVHDTTIATRVQLAAVAPRRTTTTPAVVAPPRVQARRASEAPVTRVDARPQRPTSPGEHPVRETRTVIEAPPASRPTPAPPRPAERPLPRVVAAFRKDISESPGRSPASPPRATASTSAAASQPRVTTDAPARPTVEARSPAPGPVAPLAHPAPLTTTAHQPIPGDMSSRVHPSAPAVAPSQGPVPGDMSSRAPSPPAVAPAQGPVPGDMPLVHPRTPTTTPDTSPLAASLRPRVAAPHADPSASPAQPAPARPRVTARQPPVVTPVHARPGERAARPVAARWVGEASHGTPPLRRAPARSPLASELSHPRPAVAQPAPERPRPASAPAHQPVPSVISTSSPPPPAPPPPLDVESLIKTVEQRLARELARARDVRRALR